MTEICEGMVIKLLLYPKWTRVYTQSRARDPPYYPIVGSLRVTRILDVFKIVDLGRTVIRMWAPAELTLLVQRLNRSDDEIAAGADLRLLMPILPTNINSFRKEQTVSVVISILRSLLFEPLVLLES